MADNDADCGGGDDCGDCGIDFDGGQDGNCQDNDGQDVNYDGNADYGQDNNDNADNIDNNDNVGNIDNNNINLGYNNYDSYQNNQQQENQENYSFQYSNSISAYQGSYHQSSYQFFSDNQGKTNCQVQQDKGQNKIECDWKPNDNISLGGEYKYDPDKNSSYVGIKMSIHF